ncbi:MAG: ParB/RepB/Spo0J family partition protein [Sphingorhabdus sp.]|uniref:ParB/RepB/Spo0J family partition protein n=1 Tax=Sphingorhabdus sp. TaxID=1902408 RepID=UPI00273DB4DB|nr:ParB/RepB/Spo0J family partition protein [Sphingorhabdus sp.]MDP4871783.1 ParB/RepB/Spo0J family partition protein [Sphingorhabdus sp.]MDP4927152.1 ParB/RepB/Spo0J family partition protein [Sphingorhabdus sp.]
MSNDNPAEKSPLKKKMGLGRGLDALLGEALRGDSMAAKSNSDMGSRGQGVATLSVIDIRPNPDQPRRHFADEKLDELAASIAKHGVIQPIIVRPFQGGYQIVAGERRWRATQRAQLHDIPAIIRSFDDSETLEIALLENIQRQDLNPIEEAEAYKKLTELFGHSAAELAELVHKSRSHVANMMRLLDLPPTLRDLVTEEKLSMGHARALLGSDNAVQFAMLVIKNGLSVRATEALVQQERAPKVRRKVSAGQSENADIRAVESHLGDLLGLKVRIAQKNITGAGAVTFEYGSLDQLDMLCQRLTGEKF